nr:hypothetical protein [Tanacetum cinerariifolium]
TPPATTDADSSTPLRFVHPSLARTPRCSKAYLRWMSAPLSTLYPPTTYKSSAGDSSSESSAEPSRKRCRSFAAIVTLSIHAMRSLVPSHADLLPPRKRFRDSISLEDIASPAGVLELDTHSSSEADPSESSPPAVYVAPMVLPFLCSDDSETVTEILEWHISPTPHDDMLTRWRSRVALRSSSPTTTTDADSSTPLRFVHPSLARNPRCSKAYLRWMSAPLSTLYPPTTYKSSAGDSFSESSAEPSRKRCRSFAATVTLSIHAMRSLVPSHADLLPPCKRFRDSISLEDSVEEDIDTDVLEDIEANVTDAEVAVDKDVEAGVDACIVMEIDVEDEVESSDRGTIEVGVDAVAGIDIPDERASLLDQVTSLERSNARLRGTMMMERARADRFRRRVRFMKIELRQIRRFRYYDRLRFRRLETFA